jgi:type II secretory pathway component PulF
MKTLFKPRWRRREIILLLEQLGLYVASGLTLDKTLAIIAEHAPAQRKSSVRAMLASVQLGSSFSGVLAEQVTTNGTVIGVIKQGERSGELAKALQSAHILLEKREELTKKCISAFAYPCVIGVFALLLTLGLVRGVMPQIIPLLLSLKVELPLLTKIVVAFSQGIVAYSLYGGVLIVIIFAVLRISYRKYLRVRIMIHTTLLRVPILGSVLRSYCHALFLRACGSLVVSGVSAAQSYQSACEGVGIIPIKINLESRSQALIHGASMASVLRVKELQMAPFVSALISAGESSGTLGDSFVRAADILDRNLDHSLKRMTSLIEPLMMIFMGCTVGAIALSIMMPIYDISKVLQR